MDTNELGLAMLWPIFQLNKVPILFLIYKSTVAGKMVIFAELDMTVMLKSGLEYLKLRYFPHLKRYEGRNLNVSWNKKYIVEIITPNTQKAPPPPPELLAVEVSRCYDHTRKSWYLLRIHTEQFEGGCDLQWMVASS